MEILIGKFLAAFSAWWDRLRKYTPHHDIHHHIEVERHRTSAEQSFTARCATCGWVSDSYDNRNDAERDADGHAIAMGGFSS
jgi:hypothetical protein